MSRAEFGASSGQRQLRVGEELRHALAWIVERGELRDPGLAAHAVTVTEVRVSPDLRQATVFLVPLGGGDEAEILAALRRARGFLRRRIAESVHLKFVPDLTFRIDRSFDEAERVARMLRAPTVARDLQAPSNAGEDPSDREDGDDGGSGGTCV